jgi:hypothetical protein
LGKCLKCGGELLFYSGTETARYFSYEPSWFWFFSLEIF